MNQTTWLIVGAFALAIASTDAFAAERPAVERSTPVRIYPPEHPANQGDAAPDGETPEWTTAVAARPVIIPFLPKGAGKDRPACIVCPGGGYGGLAMQKEGVEPAEWLAERGIAAFVLRYRCGGGDNQQPVPLQDAQRAIRTVRNRAEQWGVDPARVGIWGFSAGGHLAASASVFGGEGVADATDSVDAQPSRVNFTVLVYPVISMQRGTTHGGSRTNLLGPDPSQELADKWSTDQQASATTPPAFLVHASDDGAVPVKNPLSYYAALVEHGVAVEMHVFEHGGHGFGMLRGDRPADRWPELLEPWLRGQGLVE